MFPNKILHSRCHDSGPQKTLGLGLVLLANYSRADSTRAGRQVIWCVEPVIIFTPCLSHPRLWGYSRNRSYYVHEGAKHYQTMLSLQHQRCSIQISHELHTPATGQDSWSQTSSIPPFQSSHPNSWGSNESSTWHWYGAQQSRKWTAR